MWEGLKIEAGPTRPGLTAADIAAIKEVVRRKAAGFWAEGTTRTTVRKFAHDCSWRKSFRVPVGPRPRTFRLGLGSLPYAGDAQPQAGAEAPLGSGLPPR